MTDSAWRQRLFLAMVAVLPLHTVYLSAWISWKPFMVLLAVLALWDLSDGVRSRQWPWHQKVTLAFLGLMAAVAIGFPAPEHRERFIRLTLALVVGFGVLAITERRLRTPGMGARTLRVIFWSATTMALTGLVFSVLLLGLGGSEAINYLTGSTGYDVPLLDKIGKPAYLLSGFLALSNWHQDPGYGAAWAVLWATLALIASLRGLGTKRPLVDGAVIGVLWASIAMGFSRTGWVALAVSLVLVAWKVSRRGLLKRIVAATVALVLSMGLLFATDVENVGGDLPLQFAFRLRQGWDLLASITGLFESSAAFEDQFAPSEQRADVWPEYWQLFLDHPVTGAGLGVGWESNSIGQEPHNLFLELGAETGVIGLVAFALLLVVIIRQGSGALGAVALAVSLLPAFTQTVLFEPTWWFAAGLYLAGNGMFEDAAEMPVESADESGVVTPKQAAA